MWRKEEGYLINRATWSLYGALLIFTGAVLLIALPLTKKIANIAGSGPGITSFFAGAIVIMYGLFAINAGQGGAGWKSRYGPRYTRYIGHLILQLIFALFVTAPYWTLFKVVTYTELAAVLWSTAHLLIYGLLLALFGFWLALTVKSEVLQFDLKYIVFIAYLVGTFFYGQFANPFLNLTLILSEGPYQTGFFLKGYPTLMGLGLLLAFLTWRAVRKVEEAPLHLQKDWRRCNLQDGGQGKEV